MALRLILEVLGLRFLFFGVFLDIFLWVFYRFNFCDRDFLIFQLFLDLFCYNIKKEIF